MAKPKLEWPERSEGNAAEQRAITWGDLNRASG
jgi:hypothetical protein